MGVDMVLGQQGKFSQIRSVLEDHEGCEGFHKPVLFQLSDIERDVPSKFHDGVLSRASEFHDRPSTQPVEETGRRCCVFTPTS